MSIGSRIKIIADENELSLGKIGVLLGKTRGYLSSAITKNTAIGSDVLSKIIDIYPDYNIEWIITGKGEKFKSNVVLNVAKQKNVGKNTELQCNKEGITELLKLVNNYKKTTEERLDTLDLKIKTITKLKRADMEMAETLITILEKVRK